MIRRLQRAVLLSLLVAVATPVSAADPIVMLLLGIAREMVFNAVRERLMAPREPEPPPSLYPGTTVEPAQLRRMVDDGFSYLSRGQREEVFDSLHASLMDPKNAGVRASMIEYFAERAMAMRAAQDRLASLSGSEKSRLADEFRQQVAELSPEETAQLVELLQRRVLPVPRDLNDMLLAQLAR